MARRREPERDERGWVTAAKIIVVVAARIALKRQAERETREGRDR